MWLYSQHIPVYFGILELVNYAKRKKTDWQHNQAQVSYSHPAFSPSNPHNRLSESPGNQCRCFWCWSALLVHGQTATWPLNNSNLTSLFFQNSTTAGGAVVIVHRGTPASAGATDGQPTAPPSHPRSWCSLLSISAGMFSLPFSNVCSTFHTFHHLYCLWIS